MSGSREAAAVVLDDSGSFMPEWADARLRCRTLDWAKAILKALGDDFDAWKTRLRIPGPAVSTRRFHTYFCNRDGEKLRFDPDKPLEHACPRCGSIHTGEPWDGAWAMQMHGAALAQLERALLLSKLTDGTGAAAARATFETIVFYYARTYPAYPVHGDQPGNEGRVQPHRLNEAVWINGLLRAVRWSGLAAAWPEDVCSQLRTIARLAVELLRPQVNAIANHHTWMLAALAECAVFLRDGDLLAWCRDSEFGMDTQIRRGFLDDGFWHEGSITYHYYTLESVLAYYDATGPAGLSGADWRGKLILAINNPPLLAYADGRMPAYADGWLKTHLHDYAHVAEQARGLIGPEMNAAAYYRGDNPARVRLVNSGSSPDCGDRRVSRRASVAALLYQRETETAQPSPASVLLAASGIALLRNDRVRIALRFGPDGGWHDHRDKLNVDVETSAGWRSLDLGTSGYGSDFTRWLRSPLAHNLLVVDGTPQEAHTGRLVEFSEKRIVAESAYGQTAFHRSLTLAADGWRDDYSVTLNAPHLIEWVFHGDGVFSPELADSEASLSGAGGYDWLQNVRKLPPSNRLRGVWRHHGAGVALEMAVPPGFTVYWAEAPGNADGRPLGAVIIRGIAARAEFSARFSTY